MRRLAIMFVATALLAAACGDSDDEPAARSGDPGTTNLARDGATVELTAKDTAFDQTNLTAPAGPLTITFDNQDDGIMHNLHVTGSGVDEKTDIETGPVSQALEVELEPGTYTYTYVCDVHPQQMKGDLEVS